MRFIIILGAEISPEGVLGTFSKARVEKGVGLYKKLEGSKLVMSGKYSFLSRKKFKKFEASAMQEHAISLGVPKKDIILEEDSLDTLGNMYYSRRIIDNYNKHFEGKKHDYSDRIIIVTSDYHLKRTIYAAKKIFGDHYVLDFVQSKTHMGTFRKIYHYKMELFYRLLYKMFLGRIQDGDVSGIKEFLFRKHPGYKK